jgi:hypothetical protein
MFKFNEGRVASSYKVEISGFSLYGNNVDGQNPTDIGIEVNQMADFQVHDIAFKYFGYAGFLCHGWSRGVVYECDFIDNWYPGLGYAVAVIGDVTGDTHQGDYSWAQYPANTNPGWGTNQFVFVEDCYFSGGRHRIDSTYGGRYVCRYNTMEDQHLGQYAPYINTHGEPFPIGSGGRGTRAIEVYHNTLNIEDYADGICTWGGDSLIWNNTLTGTITLSHGIMFEMTSYTGDPEDYPVPAQARQSYVWGNTLNGVDCDSNEWPTASPGVRNLAPAWLVKERDFHLHELSGYTPYPYPHPLRNT